MTKSNAQHSRQRKQVQDLLDQIRKKAVYAIHSAPLIRATPSEVYRRCGKPDCRCTKNPPQKHGPYPVMQIYIDGKQKQVSIKKNDHDLLNKVKNYQKNEEEKIVEESSKIDESRVI